MLTGLEIKKRVSDGRIRISDFDEKRLNPNSYNLRLDDHLLVYEGDFAAYTTTVITLGKNGEEIKKKTIAYKNIIDSKANNPTKRIDIPESGLILYPQQLYLGTTVESVFAEGLIPCISGRSSVGRLGIEIHRTAGFGDIGFDGKWTLEITVPIPVMIYPFQELCQVYFYEPVGDPSMEYHGRYQHQDDVKASRLFMTE